MRPGYEPPLTASPLRLPDCELTAAPGTGSPWVSRTCALTATTGGNEKSTLRSPARTIVPDMLNAFGSPNSAGGAFRKPQPRPTLTSPSSTFNENAPLSSVSSLSLTPPPPATTFTPGTGTPSAVNTRPERVLGEDGAGTVMLVVVSSWASMSVVSTTMAEVAPGGVYDVRRRAIVPGNVCRSAVPLTSVTDEVGLATCWAMVRPG